MIGYCLLAIGHFAVAHVAFILQVLSLNLILLRGLGWVKVGLLSIFGSEPSSVRLVSFFGKFERFYLSFSGGCFNLRS